MDLSLERLSQHRPTAPTERSTGAVDQHAVRREIKQVSTAICGSHTATGGITGLTLNMI